MLTKQALYEVARISSCLEKTAAPAWWTAGNKFVGDNWDKAGTALKGVWGSTGQFREGLKGAVSDIGNYAKNNAGNFAGKAWKGLSEAVTGKQFRRGLIQMRHSLPQGGNVIQPAFNAGLKNMAMGAAKTTALGGAAIYGGSKLFGGGSQPANPMYYQGMPE